MDKYGYVPEDPSDLEKRAGKEAVCPVCGAQLSGTPPVCPSCGSRPFEKRNTDGQKDS
jgi:rubrerythrin